MVSKRWVGVVLILAAMVMAWVVVGRGREEREPATSRTVPTGRRSLVIVTVDTTRADHLQPYGSETVETPMFERLAQSGILFEQALAVAPITLVAHSSILTGLYPFEHGVRNNGIQYLADEVTTLTETLSAQDYRTGAFVSAAVLERRYGLAQGFDVFDDDLSAGRDRSPRAVPDRPAEATVASARAWLSKVAPDENFFLWVHFYDPHARYSPPPPFRDRYQGRLYDGEIAYMDSQLQALLEHDRLLGAEKSEQPIVLVVGDHGESLGEHREQTHAILAYDSTLHVPFILRVPGGPGGLRIEEPVSQVDIVPTLHSLLGLSPIENVSGRDLLPLLQGSPGAARALPLYSETYLPFYTYGWSKLRTLRQGRWKYIDAPTPELYDMVKDPRELTNLAKTQPGMVHDLSRDLQALRDRVADAEIEASLSLDSESAEKLRSLGYLSTGNRAREEGGQRPDPKDVIDLHVGLEKARSLLGDRLFEAARQQLEKVLKRDADNLAALIDLASALDGLGQRDEAVKVLERALSIDPEYLRLYVALSRLEARRGRMENALELVEIASGRDPRDPAILIQKATLLARMGRNDEAEVELEKGLKLHPEHALMNVSYARIVEMRQNRFEEAGRRLQRAVRRDPFLSAGWHTLGQLQERMREPEAAVASYRKGLEGRPDDIELHAALGFLLARRGQAPEAQQHLEEAVRLSPTLRADLHISLGGLLAEAGRFEEAQKEYRRVLSVQPDHPGARNNAAIALFRMGRHEEAEAQLHALVADFPEMADAHNNLAAIAIEEQDWQKVEFHARRTLEIDPELPQAWNNLAVAMEEQAQTLEAREAWEKALSLSPTYWEARFNLGALLARVGEPAAAAETLEAVLVQVPGLPDAHFELGKLFALSLGEPDKARVHLNAFLRHGVAGDPRREEARALVKGL